MCYLSTHVFYMNMVFFFNDTATTEIYTLSLHDALPICRGRRPRRPPPPAPPTSASSTATATSAPSPRRSSRSEEHTSELQSRQYLVCRLLLEKKKKSGMRSNEVNNPISV